MDKRLLPFEKQLTPEASGHILPAHYGNTLTMLKAHKSRIPTVALGSLFAALVPASATEVKAQKQQPRARQSKPAQTHRSRSTPEFHNKTPNRTFANDTRIHLAVYFLTYDIFDQYIKTSVNDFETMADVRLLMSDLFKSQAQVARDPNLKNTSTPKARFTPIPLQPFQRLARSSAARAYAAWDLNIWMDRRNAVSETLGLVDDIRREVRVEVETLERLNEFCVSLSNSILKYTAYGDRNATLLFAISQGTVDDLLVERRDFLQYLDEQSTYLRGIKAVSDKDILTLEDADAEAIVNSPPVKI